MPRSSELLGRGMRCVTACANIARTQRTQIRITSYLLRRKLGGAAVQIKSLAAEFRHKPSLLERHESPETISLDHFLEIVFGQP